jgi:hypothetical protein
LPAIPSDSINDNAADAMDTGILTNLMAPLVNLCFDIYSICK